MEQMRVALGQFNELTNERLTFAQQLGVRGVQMNTPRLSEKNGYWELDELIAIREKCESYGLRLEALENVPRHFYLRAMLGLSGRDEDIEKYQTTIRNMGQAGIPVLGYNWMPNGVWRTPHAEGRGGARVTAFDMAQVEAAPLVAGIKEVDLLEGRTIDHETMWENYRYFITAVLPVAEEAGVKLALHPDDPPVRELGGIARLFYDTEGFKRALEEIGPSPNHGLDLCLGCFSEMGLDVLDVIRYFGTRDKIIYIHLRDVQGCVPAFQECFLGEGNFDPVAVVRTLHEVGFTGFILDDHVPHMIDDSDWNHRGHAHGTGYIMGLVDTVMQLA